MASAPSARPTSTNELTQLVNLNSHGFFVGQNVIYNGAWVLANASTAAGCAGTWLVSLVPGANSFYLTQTGWVNNLNPAYFDAGSIVAGQQYYLSVTNPGFFTAVRPSATGQTILPCLVCDTTTTGYFYGGSGQIIKPATLENWVTVTANTLMVPNTNYFVNSASNINMTLPTVFNEGDTFGMAMVNTGTFTVVQQNSPMQQILVLGGTSTAGSGGSVVSDDLHCRVDLVGYIANTTLHCESNGSISVT